MYADKIVNKLPAWQGGFKKSRVTKIMSSTNELRREIVEGPYWRGFYEVQIISKIQAERGDWGMFFIRFANMGGVSFVL